MKKRSIDHSNNDYKLEALSLINCTFKMKPLHAPESSISVDIKPLIKNTVDRTHEVEIVTNIRGTELNEDLEEVGTRRKKPWLEFSATYFLVITENQKIKEKDSLVIEASVKAIWPFIREFSQNMFFRAGIPAIIVPMNLLEVEK
ncbi:hypothetical protein V4762_04505 [Thermodesulfobium sp. 4217-1]|uniref:hypothetical protein n=1 Tax=Thermodesulfobium sp. 4217-1 TaxID=3120013 RepID=UPI0032214307